MTPNSARRKGLKNTDAWTYVLSPPWNRLCLGFVKPSVRDCVVRQGAVAPRHSLAMARNSVVSGELSEQLLFDLERDVPKHILRMCSGTALLSKLLLTIMRTWYMLR